MVSEKESIAIATGKEGMAKGSIGCFLTLAEWKEAGNEWHIVDVKSVKVDGDKIKPDTFYRLHDGAFLEVQKGVSG